MSSKSYVFYAVFSDAEDGISITFPDIPECISCAYSPEEALSMAKEALELYLEDMKEEDIPKSRRYNEFEPLESNQKLVPVEVTVNI